MKKFFLLTMMVFVISVGSQTVFSILSSSPSKGIINTANAAVTRCDYNSADNLKDLKFWITDKMNDSYKVVSILNRGSFVEALVCRD